MEHLRSILRPGLEDRGAYLADRGASADTAIWDELAAADHVHAAISVSDEADEREKTEPLVDVLLAEAIDGVVLDVGCGYGRIAKYLLPRRTFPGYVGVDGSETMLRLFRERYERSSTERTTPLVLIHSPADLLPIDDASIGNVVIAGVLLHNPKSVNTRLIAESHRVLVPGGKLFVLGRDLINSRTLGGLQSQLYLRVLRARGEGERNGPSHPYSIDEINRLFAAFSRVAVRAMEFRLLPKSVIGLPGGANDWYRRLVYEPSQTAVRTIVPEPVRRRSPDHWQVVATK